MILRSVLDGRLTPAISSTVDANSGSVPSKTTSTSLYFKLFGTVPASERFDECHTSNDASVGVIVALIEAVLFLTYGARLNENN